MTLEDQEIYLRALSRKAKGDIRLIERAIIFARLENNNNVPEFQSVMNMIDKLKSSYQCAAGTSH